MPEWYFVALVDPFWRSDRFARRPAAAALKDAANYITKLPNKESDLAEWQVAIEALMLCSRGGDPMLPRISFMKALNRNVVIPFNPDAKKHNWGTRKLKRDS